MTDKNDRAIWSSYTDLPNSLPASSGTTTRDYLSFFLFWLGSLPAIWFPVHKIRHLFTVKAYFVPCAGFAYFGWAVARANGIGPIVHQGNTIHGSALGWAMVKGIMSSIANFATLIVNDPDFARFAKKPRDALWSQLFTIPCGFAITSFIGIIVSSSSKVIFGEAIWNPLDLLSKFLEGATHGERFGVFIIAAAFTLAQLGTNIAANSVSAGTDMTALLPRFLNIRRGGYICAIVGLAMCPVSPIQYPQTAFNTDFDIVASSLVVKQFYHLSLGILRLSVIHCWCDHLRLLRCPQRLFRY